GEHTGARTCDPPGSVARFEPREIGDAPSGRSRDRRHVGAKTSAGRRVGQRQAAVFGGSGGGLSTAGDTSGFGPLLAKLVGSCATAGTRSQQSAPPGEATGNQVGRSEFIWLFYSFL